MVSITSHVSLTCCRLGDINLWGLLLLLWQEGGHAAQLREAATAAAAAGGGQTSTLQLLRLHLTDIWRVRGCGGLCAEGRCCVGART